MEKLVSIISPCYNGEHYVDRLLGSIMAQSYNNLEVIIVNDGSTDNTKDVVLSYMQRCESKGIKLVYLEQDNQGQSAAINKALPIFTGDYIAFVDSDDILTNDAIEKKVAYMDSHPSVGLLINKVKVLDFDTLVQIGTMERKLPKGGDHLFADLISGNNVFYTPGGYFWRSSMFREAMPKPLKIVAPREIGQNFQLIMPIAYKYPIGYLDEYLYNYLVRKDSHSRTYHTYEQRLHNWEIAKNVLSSVADDVETTIDKRKHIQDLIEFRYYREIMDVAYNYNRKSDYKKYRNRWIKLKIGKSKSRMFFEIAKIGIIRNLNNLKSLITKMNVSNKV